MAISENLIYEHSFNVYESIESHLNEFNLNCQQNTFICKLYVLIGKNHILFVYHYNHFVCLIPLNDRIQLIELIPSSCTLQNLVGIEGVFNTN